MHKFHLTQVNVDQPRTFQAQKKFQCYGSSTEKLFFKILAFDCFEKIQFDIFVIEIKNIIKIKIKNILDKDKIFCQ